MLSSGAILAPVCVLIRPSYIESMTAVEFISGIHPWNSSWIAGGVPKGKVDRGARMNDDDPVDDLGEKLRLKEKQAEVLEVELRAARRMWAAKDELLAAVKSELEEVKRRSAFA